MRAFDYSFLKVAFSSVIVQAQLNRSPKGKCHPQDHALGTLENVSKHLGFQAHALAPPLSPKDSQALLPPPSPET